MKIGDKVKVNNRYFLKNVRNMKGIIICIQRGGVDIGVRFKEEFAYGHDLNGTCEPKKGRWFSDYQLELIRPMTPRESVMF